MAPPPDHLSPIDADQLCDAATAVFFAVVAAESRRRGVAIGLPSLLCPAEPPPCPCGLDPDLAAAAEQFLVRLGMVYFDEHYRLRLRMT